MKILVAYFSETGNTKAIAQAMGEEAAIGGNDVRIRTVGEISGQDLNEYDVVFLGSTCHSGDVAAPVRNILDGIPQGSTFKLAGFVTHATLMPEEGAWQKEMYETWAGKCPATFAGTSKDKGIGFLGFFHCLGAPNPQIGVFIHNTIITDETRWSEYIEDARKHPDAADIESAKEFARSALAKCEAAE